MKNNFRHFSSWLMIIGIVVSFFAYLNATNIYAKVKYAEAEANQYRYTNSYYIGIAGIHEENADMVMDALTQIGGNISFTNLNVYMNQTGKYQAAELLLHQTEEFPYPIEYVDEKWGEVYIGENIRQYCYVDEENEALCINLNGRQYFVKGILKSENSNLLNNKIIIDYIPDKSSELISSYDAYALDVGSNRTVLDDSLMDFFNEMGSTCTIYYEKNDAADINVGSAMEEEKFYMIISLFAIVNCVIISEFWIIRRKREMIIRKLWGFSDIRIFTLLYRDMLLNSGTAVILVLITQCLIQWLTDSEYGKFSFSNVWNGIIFTIVSSIIIVLIPLYKTKEYRVSEGMCE